MFLFEHAHAPSQSDWTKREINFNSRPINKLMELLQPFGVDLEIEAKLIATNLRSRLNQVEAD